MEYRNSIISNQVFPKVVENIIIINSCSYNYIFVKTKFICKPACISRIKKYLTHIQSGTVKQYINISAINIQITVFGNYIMNNYRVEFIFLLTLKNYQQRLVI